MPRVSLRRGLLYLSAATTFSLLLVSVHQPGGTWLNGPASSPITLRRQQQQGAAAVPAAAAGGGGSHADHPVLEVVEEEAESGARPNNGAAGPQDALEDGALAEPDTYQRVLPSVPRPQPLPNVSLTTLPPAVRPWYLEGGQLRPDAPLDGEQWLRSQRLWPDEETSDRIVEQLMFRPPPPPHLEDHPDPSASDRSSAPPPFKKILMYNGMNSWGLRAGRGQFMKLRCPVDTCVLTGSRSEISTADAVMFKDHFSMPPNKRDPRQVWVMFMLECPMHTQHFTNKNVFNWTATYRHDSDIVAPYEKWVHYDPSIRQKPQEINYAANKTKQVAWFVSNCGARNNRLQYAKELGKYIGVDIFGACGTKRCPRSNSAKCFEMLNKDYKFYLAFENSNCRDYITEKFFVNGLSRRSTELDRDSKGHHILPIVMGAHPDDYARQAPEKSYIHVDDFESPKDLADFLHLLDQNDDLYNEYFRWKGTGEFINTYFMCRLCAMLHDEGHQQHYEDINMWWRGTGTCINGSWRKYDKMKMESERNKKQQLLQQQQQQQQPPKQQEQQQQNSEG
ncbi:glycoprotein 3-alpha-L-fucosyltransferase A isoform X2 [Macrobrachium rosenbergii]|uniref:glycoprotein 3-alpha-L-fucosyltransferase A isoform X2 n=1 Tax=Macrobrachium rosenbergii TaxID=79674 RepID=UPI0034D7A294